MRPARLSDERGALFLRPAYDENRPLLFEERAARLLREVVPIRERL